MYFVNILIENYDLDNLETLSNEEIKILLSEISLGLEFLKFEKNSQNARDVINSKNLPLLNNLGSEADNRKISTESDSIKSFLAEYENVHQKKIKIENSDDEIIENDINIETATYAKYAEHVSEKIENGQPKYECKLCEHSGKFKSGLIHHIRTRHLGIRFECSECGENYSTKQTCIYHISTCHSNLTNVKCQEVIACDYKQVALSKTIACNVCGHECKNLHQLKCHISAEHKGKRLKCLECGQLYRSHISFKRHSLRSHKNLEVQSEEVVIDQKIRDRQGKFECLICHKFFKRKFDLKTHTEIQHNLRRFKCSECGIYYSFKHACFDHISKCHGQKLVTIEEIRLENSRIHPCDICGEVFTRARVLNVHKRFKHEGIRLKCLECGTLFSNRISARRHFAKSHGNVEMKTETIRIF